MAFIYCIEYVAVVLVGLFWSISVILRMFLSFLNTPTHPWSYTVRKERPVCLESTEDWTHNLVSLQHEEVKLHYVSAGDAGKPLMVFLHGFPECWYSWRSQLKYFKEDYRVVALSLRGYGDSDSPKSVDKYTISYLIEDVHGLVNSLDASEFTIVGHDWGGVIAWAFATTYPELVTRMIILNAPHPISWNKLYKTNIKQFFMSWYRFYFLLPYLPEYSLSRQDFASLRRVYQSFGASEEEIEAYLYYFSQKGGLNGPLNFYRASLRYQEKIPVPKGKLNMPVLIIWGTDDLALAEILATKSADYCSNVIIKKIVGGNHFIQQHRPDDVNRYIDEFLKS